MSHTHTIDDIWKLFQETNRLFQEAKREAELAAERRQQEADLAAERRRREFEREMEAKRADTERRIQEAERQFRETDRKFQETDRIVKEVSRQIGQLGSRWGEFVEGLVAPACETLFAARGIPVREVYQRVKARLPGNRHLEIDLLAVNGDVVIPIEVKSRLRVEDVRDFLRRLGELKEFMPRYADARVLGAVAGIVVDENVDRYAMNEGLFVIVQSGDTVRLANDQAFVPRTW